MFQNLCARRSARLGSEGRPVTSFRGTFLLAAAPLSSPETARLLFGGSALCCCEHPHLPARLTAEEAGGGLGRRGERAEGLVRAPRGVGGVRGGRRGRGALSAGRAAFPSRMRLLCSVLGPAAASPSARNGVSARAGQKCERSQAAGKTAAELGFRGPSGLPVTVTSSSFPALLLRRIFTSQHFL